MVARPLAAAPPSSRHRAIGSIRAVGDSLAVEDATTDGCYCSYLEGGMVLLYGVAGVRPMAWR